MSLIQGMHTNALYYYSMHSLNNHINIIKTNRSSNDSLQICKYRMALYNLRV